MQKLIISLPDSTHAALTARAESHGIAVEHYCSILLSELTASDRSSHPAAANPPASPPQVPPEPKPRVLFAGLPPRAYADLPKPRNGPSQTRLLKDIIAYLRLHGRAARKTEVETALFEEYPEEFCHPYYAERIGGGVPRWKKNIQFARNTGKDLGLIKPPEDSGRGLWELTEKGRDWEP